MKKHLTVRRNKVRKIIQNLKKKKPPVNIFVGIFPEEALQIPLCGKKKKSF